MRSWKMCINVFFCVRIVVKEIRMKRCRLKLLWNLEWCRIKNDESIREFLEVSKQRNRKFEMTWQGFVEKQLREETAPSRTKYFRSAHLLTDRMHNHAKLCITAIWPTTNGITSRNPCWQEFVRKFWAFWNSTPVARFISKRTKKHIEEFHDFGWNCWKVWAYQRAMRLSLISKNQCSAIEKRSSKVSQRITMFDLFTFLWFKQEAFFLTNVKTNWVANTVHWF